MDNIPILRIVKKEQREKSGFVLSSGNGKNQGRFQDPQLLFFPSQVQQLST